MDNYLESSQLFQQLPFSFILMRTNDLICFQQLEQNFHFGLKLPDMIDNKNVIKIIILLPVWFTYLKTVHF